jgi:hypothetical protein
MQSLWIRWESYGSRAVILKLKSVEQRATDTLWIRYTVVRS